MRVKILVLSVIAVLLPHYSPFRIFAHSLPTDNVEDDITISTWHCENICTACSGEAYYNQDSKKCHCVMKKALTPEAETCKEAMQENADVLDIKLVIEELNNEIGRVTRSIPEDTKNDYSSSMNHLEGPSQSAIVNNVDDTQSIVGSENPVVEDNESPSTDNKVIQTETQTRRGRLPTLRRSRPIFNLRSAHLFGQPETDVQETVDVTRPQDIQETVQQIRDTMDRISQRLKAIAPETTKQKLSKIRNHSQKNAAITVEDQTADVVVEPEGLDQEQTVQSAQVVQNVEQNVEENQEDNAIVRTKGGIARRLSAQRRIPLRARQRPILRKTLGRHQVVTTQIQTTQLPQRTNDENENTIVNPENVENPNDTDLLAEETLIAEENTKKDKQQVIIEENNTPITPIVK